MFPPSGSRYSQCWNLATAIACNCCHDLIDGQKKTADYTRDELRLMHAECVLRTSAIWKKEGLLKA
ncbi:TPA: DUF1364 family protein [Klebsiella aerogenes]|nr:DUF1364 family protein [Klebsiella aerogenes]HEO9967305.1 DUF1364 family protein [Klebsiella aerogenes]